MKFRKKSLVWAMILTMAGSILLPASSVTAYAAAGEGVALSQADTQADGAASKADIQADNAAPDMGLLSGQGPEGQTVRSQDDVTMQARSPVSMEVEYGYDGAAKSGRFIPVRVSLVNEAVSEFKGTVRVQAMEADFDIYDYDYPVSLEGNESFQKSYDIPVGKADILYVKLLNESGEELVRKRLKVNVSVEVAELFVGIVSDTPEKLAYLNGVGVNYSQVRTKTFAMNQNEIPEDVSGLDLLDVLLVTNYDTGNLTEGQVNAIEEWVKRGGTLLIGTGGRADDTLAAFRSGLLETDYPSPELRSVDMGVEYATNGPGDSFINLMCADVTLKGGTEVLTNDEFPVLTSTVRGKGVIGVAAYDFVDIASFCETQRSYVDKLFSSLIGEDKLNNLSSYLYSGNSSMYWSVQSILNSGDVDKLPNLPLYVIVILGYIILVGPGLYLILKKQERRRLYRFAVAALALGFTGLIYLMGVGTRFKAAFFTYATIYDTSDKTIDEYTYINMRTPYNKPYSISLDPSYDLLPITRSYYYDMTPVPKFTGDEDYKVRVRYDEDETKVSLQNVVAFTPKYFSLKKKTVNEEHMGMTGDVTLFDGKITGTITNHYPFPVEKAGVLAYGQMVVIDELQPGETVVLDGLSVSNYPLNNSSMVAERITGGNKYLKPDIEDENYMLALSRTNILSFYLDTYASSYSPEARIVAFGNGQSENRFLSKDGYETYGVTLYTSALDVNTKKDGYTSRSVLMKAPTVISGQYYAASNYAYGIDPVALEYSLGNDIEVERLKFERLSDEFINSEKYSYMTYFKGTIYFYNHDTGVYDAMDSAKAEYTAKELEPYLSPGNTMTIKYVFDGNTDYSWVTLPMLTVLGRDK